MTWNCRPQSAGAETGALPGLEGKEYLAWPQEQCQRNGTSIWKAVSILRLISVQDKKYSAISLIRNTRIAKPRQPRE